MSPDPARITTRCVYLAELKFRGLQGDQLADIDAVAYWRFKLFVFILDGGITKVCKVTNLPLVGGNLIIDKVKETLPIGMYYEMVCDVTLLVGMCYKRFAA